MMKILLKGLPTLLKVQAVVANIKAELQELLEAEEAVEDVVEEAAKEDQGDPKDLPHLLEDLTLLQVVAVDLREEQYLQGGHTQVQVVITKVLVDPKGLEMKALVLTLDMVHQELEGLEETLLVDTPVEMLGNSALMQVTLKLKPFKVLNMIFETKNLNIPMNDRRCELNPIE